jgi:hypothetical protein
MIISEVTRRNIIDALCRTEPFIPWHGRLGEIEFLARLFDLEALPSTDGRFRDAAGDIWQHRVSNYDWEYDWVYTDPRFNLLYGADEVFLRFLCEMVHPVVRPDLDQVAYLVNLFNDNLVVDGWELVERTRLSGRPMFAARPLLVGAGLSIASARTVATALDAGYITQQITRMESAVESDPELAVGTAKEFVETVCKTILHERGVAYSEGEDFPKLVRMTLKELKLAPDDIPNHAKASETIRILLQNFATIANGLAELRNPYGTGHGKEARSKGLRARHARLAVGAASTLAVFLFETHMERAAIP